MRERGLIAVYIMASRRNGTLYVGVTSDLRRRLQQHKAGDFQGFSKKYGCKTLVWFEIHDSIIVAIHREKQLKHWLRVWKLQLIENDNPNWRDLSDDLFDEGWDQALEPIASLLIPSSSGVAERRPEDPAS